jgi:hypothetical protein
MVHQTLEPYPAEAPAAALGRIPVPELRKVAQRVSKAAAEAAQLGAEQLRRACPEQAKRAEGSERMQPTAQAVGTEQSEQTSPGGAKEISPRIGLMPESKTKTAGRKNTGAPSLRSVQEPALSESKGWAAQKPAAMQELSVPRKPPGRVASGVIAQGNAVNATPMRE